MARQLLDKYLDSDVSASGQDVWTAPVVPTGETWHLTRFGGGAVDAALIALQLRTSTGPDVWETLRVVAAPGQAEYLVDRDLVGDGALRLRVVRQEKSGLGTRGIFAWLEGYKMT